MKFSTAAISILLSAPALGYTPSSNFKQPIRSTSTTSLRYTDAIETETPKIEWQATDDDFTSKIKKELGFSEGTIQEEYSNWLLKYGKVADEARYLTYKKNFLMQEEYNAKMGSSFSLNGYGDLTEKEYLELKAGVSVAEPEVVEPELAVVEDYVSTVEPEELLVEDVSVVEPELVVEEEEEEEEPVVVEDVSIVETELVVEEGEEEEEEEEPVVEEESVTLEVEELVVEKPKVEIIDETDDLFVEKYQAIDDAEERAFEVLKDLNIVKPAPQHFSFSYVDGTPELKLEGGATYLDALHNPDLSNIDGAATMSGYLASMIPSESGTFEEGKKGAKLGASEHYLDDICDMLEPFMDCGKARTPIQISSPVEDFVNDRVSQIKAMGDKAFQVLVELCSIGRCERK